MASEPADDDGARAQAELRGDRAGARVEDRQRAAEVIPVRGQQRLEQADEAGVLEAVDVVGLAVLVRLPAISVRSAPQILGDDGRAELSQPPRPSLRALRSSSRQRWGDFTRSFA